MWRRSPLQGPCCCSKHLPLCGRPSRPIVVQKLVVLPLAPLRLQRHAADPLVVSGSDMCSDRCVAPATITTGCGPFALTPRAQYHCVFSFAHPALSQGTLAGQHSRSFSPLFLLYSCSPFGVYAYCSSEHPHYTHGYILRGLSL